MKGNEKTLFFFLFLFREQNIPFFQPKILFQGLSAPPKIQKFHPQIYFTPFFGLQSLLLAGRSLLRCFSIRPSNC
jgi:flagellar biosynthesis protein FlhB